MSTTKLSLVLGLAFCSLVVAPSLLPAAQPASKEEVNKLLAVLKSDAAQADKVTACRQLVLLGSKDAVPTLAALLADEKLAHMARYALEPLADPSVDDAFRDALNKLQGPPLVGVIGSIGVRRDAKAVAPLGSLLTAPDRDVAEAAARALGSIGNAPAAKALQAALPTAAKDRQLAVCEGLFRCAEQLQRTGDHKTALAIYDQLRRTDAPHQVRAGALRGAIVLRGEDGVKLLRESLRDNDYILAAAAARAAHESSAKGVNLALAEELKGLPADRQILVLQTLIDLNDPTANPAVIAPVVALAKTGPKPVRLAATRALAAMHTLPNRRTSGVDGDLASLLSDSDSEIAQAAQESLASLPGRQVDDRVMAMLASPETAQRLLAIELIGRRRMTDAVPALLKAASDADATVRLAALKRVGELASPSQVPALLDLLDRAKAGPDLEAVEQALSGVGTRATKPDDVAAQLTARLARVQPAQKAALIRVLGAVGGTQALNAVRAAVADGNSDVQATALRTLASWKTVDAAPHLIALAKTATTATDRTLCLRGYLGWAGQAEVPAAQRLKMCEDAKPLLQTDEEKRLLLGALGRVKAVEALPLAVPYLDDAAVREEACAAVVTIADESLKGDQAAGAAAKLIEPLAKAAQSTSNADLGSRAKGLLDQARAKAGGARP
jgi:HEAT repeat protein